MHTLRYKIVFGLLILAMAGLCLRLAVLMRGLGDEALTKARAQQRAIIRMPGRPGGIYARSSRRYVPLAVSRQAPSCYVDPFMLADDELVDVSFAVAPALKMEPSEVQVRLTERRDKRFAWIKRCISEDEAEQIRRLRIPAVGVQYEWRREYPNQGLAATVVGFCRSDQAPGGGLELALHDRLAATDGQRLVLVDARRRAIDSLPEQSRPPRDGDNVFLSLDAVIQGFLEEAVSASVEKFSAKWGTGLAVEPQTGRVLAMCSVPSYDPNRFNQADAECLTNRAISVPFEPGSAFKPVMAAAAVDAGVLTYQTQIFCENGTYHAERGGQIKDHGKSYGNLTVADGVVFSSNICMAKVGEHLGNDLLYEAARRFGFGQPTNIGLPGESGGILRPLAKWDTYSLRRVPFGQEISVSPLQLTMAFCSLANGGLLLRPRLVDQVIDANGNVVYRSERQVVRRVLSPSVAAQTLNVLKDVVERGTGSACKMKDWQSFGKTGTAQIAGIGGYTESAYVGSFVGGAPLGNPRILCLISIYWPQAGKGYYGATVAAPYVKDVLVKSMTYLGVPPDRIPQDLPPAGVIAMAGR